MLEAGPDDPSVLYEQNIHISEHCAERTRVIDTIDHFFKVNLISVDDARIQELLRRAGFLHYSWLSYVRLDRALITALLERWRPETYTFHLGVGEMTITLQDVAVLLGLRIDGPPVVGSTGRDWDDLALRLLGRGPPASDKKKGQVRLVWLREQFSVLPPADATQVELEQYVRAYILHQIGCSLFPDTNRNLVHLRWLTLLDDLDQCGQLSWGSAVLAFLFSELTEAALGRDKIGGCLTLLLAWSWTRVAVGLPTLGPREYDPIGTIWAQAFVDSGAQSTIISKSCAERCGLLRLLDQRFRGVAVGVGQSEILGRVHVAPIKIGHLFYHCSFTVLDASNMEFLFGLDMLRKHQCIIDLKENVLRVGGGEVSVPFLQEKDIPAHIRDEARLAQQSSLGQGSAPDALGDGDKITKTATSARSSGTLQSNRSEGADMEAKITKLVELGFDREAALQALRLFNGNEEQAAGYLFGG